MAPSPLSDSVAAEQARAQEDWAEAQRNIQVLSDTNTSLSQLVDDAAALDVTQTAEIQALKDERDGLVADAAAAKAALDSFDLNPTFPPVATPPAEGGGEPPAGGGTGVPPGGGVNPEPAPLDPGVGTGVAGGPPPPPEVTETPADTSVPAGGTPDTGTPSPEEGTPPENV